MSDIHPNILHDEADHLHPSLSESMVSSDESIVSVNAKGNSPQGNRAGKAAFLVVCGALLVGGVVWFGQHWMTQTKEHLRDSSKKPGSSETVDLFNPEGSKVAATPPKLGAAGERPSAPRSPGVSEADNDMVRPMRGPDGKVLVNAQGKSLGVDRNGQVVEVPAIAVLTGDATNAKKPLPGQPAASVNATAAAGTSTGQAASSAPQPSRYGGALFVESSSASSGPSAAQATPKDSTQAAMDLMRILSGQGASPSAAPTPSPAFPMANAGLGVGNGSPRPGSVGAQLSSSATPVARASRIMDQSLMLPKGRQADCILTTRIIDELPGFTSCVLSQNLYSDDGRVLLLERGSEVSGEYGTSNQQGAHRLFVTWTRVKTPGGIEIDFQSPGADSLGGSGIPGFLDKRWGERIGAALLLSVMKDTLAVALARQAPPQGSGTNINIQPGSNTIQSGQNIAEAVLADSMKARPTLSINEGERISIYVARDLDFSTVYRLRASGSSGAVRVN